MKHGESLLQRACVAWFRAQYPRYARLLFAVPNGGFRSRTEAAIMRGEGVVAGVADLLLLVPRPPCHGLCVEMKCGRNGQSPGQVAWQRDAEEQGYKYVVCRSVEQFIDVISTYIDGDIKKF